MNTQEQLLKECLESLSNLSKERLFEEIRRITKENGKLAIIEWKKKETKMGPPAHHRIGKDEVINICQKNGLNVEKEFEWADSFYGVVVS